jgi:hypothetical protein
MKVGRMIEMAHGSTTDLADNLRSLAEGHATDHAVYHVGHLLADRSVDLASSLEPFAEQYGQHVGDEDGDGLHELGERMRRGTAALLGRSEATGMLLLRDLRDLAAKAHGVQMDWTVLKQSAMVAQDQPLLEAATRGIEETKRVVVWLTTRIKESAPQIVAG